MHLFSLLRKRLLVSLRVSVFPKKSWSFSKNLKSLSFSLEEIALRERERERSSIVKERRERERERRGGRFARARERAVQKKVRTRFKRARVIFFWSWRERERASDKKIRVLQFFEVADFRERDFKFAPNTCEKEKFCAVCSRPIWRALRVFSYSFFLSFAPCV